MVSIKFGACQKGRTFEYPDIINLKRKITYILPESIYPNVATLFLAKLILLGLIFKCLWAPTPWTFLNARHK